MEWRKSAKPDNRHRRGHGGQAGAHAASLASDSQRREESSDDDRGRGASRAGARVAAAGRPKPKKLLEKAAEALAGKHLGNCAHPGTTPSWEELGQELERLLEEEKP